MPTVLPDYMTAPDLPKNGRVVNENGIICPIKTFRSNHNVASQATMIAAVPGYNLRMLQMTIQNQGANPVVATIRDGDGAYFIIRSLAVKQIAEAAAPYGGFLFKGGDGVSLTLTLDAAELTEVSGVYYESPV